MEDKRFKILLEKFAQSTGTSTPIVKNITDVDIKTMPGFNSNVFKLRQDIIPDFNNIVKIINTNIYNLSNKATDFTIVWTNPSLSGSAFTNSVKNLVNLGKWLYSVLTVKGNGYDINAIKQIINQFITTLASYSFPEPAASNVKSQLTTLAQSILSKLGS